MKLSDRDHPMPAGNKRASVLRSLVGVLLSAALLGPQAIASAQSPGATLAMGSGSGAPGATGVAVGVTLSSQGGAQVSAVNFDIGFDASRLSVGGVSLGSGPGSVGKSLSSSQPSAGVLRLVIQGGNSAIPDGTLATVSFTVIGGAAPGTSSLSLGNAVASDPSANPVPLTLVNGSFTVLAPPSTNTPVPSATATATSTNTPGPSATPTSTRTPSNTPTPTPSRTPGPSPTPSRTRTPSRTPTRGPSPTPVTPATSTRTPTATTAPISTATSAVTSPSAPAPTVSESAPPSATASAPGPTGSPTYPPALETAAAATGTALADLDRAVAATATALAVAASPPGGTPSPAPGPLAVAAAIIAVVAFFAGAGLLIWTGLKSRRRPTGPA